MTDDTLCSARRLDRGYNVFIGILKNYYFMVIFCISTFSASSSSPRQLLTSLLCSVVAGQYLIIQFGGQAFQVVPIGAREWGISVIVGAMSLPLAILIRTIPPGPFARFMVRTGLYPDEATLLGRNSPQAEEQQWNDGINKVVDNLTVFGQIRGGRMRSSSMVLKSRSKQMKKLDIHPTSLMAMVPSLGRSNSLSLLSSEYLFIFPNSYGIDRSWLDAHSWHALRPFRFRPLPFFRRPLGREARRSPRYRQRRQARHSIRQREDWSRPIAEWTFSRRYPSWRDESRAPFSFSIIDFRVRLGRKAFFVTI